MEWRTNSIWIRSHANIFLLITLAGFYLLTLTTNYYSFAQIDDYSHWGRMSRNLVASDRFVVASDVIGVKDYPPGLAIIHYLYSNFAGYRDSLALYAQAVFVFSCLAVPFETLDVRGEKFRLLGFILMLLASLSLTWILFFGLHTLWADLPLGMLFGLALWLYFSGNDSRVSRIFRIAPIILILPLIKQMGLAFSLIVFLIISIDLVLSRKKNIVSGLFIIIAIVCSALAIESSWKLYLLGQGIQRTFQSSFGIVEVVKAFIPTYSSLRQKITIEAFINHFFKKTHFTTYWIFLSVIAGLAAYKSSAADRKAEVAVQVGAAFIGLLLYLALLLVLYMFSFSEFEGTRVASINRYTNTYLLGLLFGFGGLFVSNVCSGWSWRTEKVWIGVVAFLFIAPNFGRTANDVAKSISGTEAPYLAPKIRALADKVSRVTPENAKIYFVWANGSNDESVIFNYSIAPRTSNTDCSNIRPKGQKTEEIDPFSCWLDQKELSARLAEYDYLFVGNVSDELRSFITTPSEMYKVSAGELYSIANQDGALKFTKIDLN